MKEMDELQGLSMLELHYDPINDPKSKPELKSIKKDELKKIVGSSAASREGGEFMKAISTTRKEKEDDGKGGDGATAPGETGSPGAGDTKEELKKQFLADADEEGADDDGPPAAEVHQWRFFSLAAVSFLTFSARRSHNCP